MIQSNTSSLQVINHHNPSFQISVDDVIQYTLAFVSSPGGDELKEDLCDTLCVSLLDSPTSIVDKLLSDSDNDQLCECFLVTVQLLMNGFLPPLGLCSSILAIFLEKDGNSLTNHLLNSQTTNMKIFGNNLGELCDKLALIPSVRILSLSTV